MTKQSVNVVITTGAGFSVTADDAVKDGQGIAAYGALENGRDIRVDNGTTITVVPHRAVDHAVVTLSLQTLPDPVDDVCP